MKSDTIQEISQYIIKRIKTKDIVAKGFGLAVIRKSDVETYPVTDNTDSSVFSLFDDVNDISFYIRFTGANFNPSQNSIATYSFRLVYWADKKKVAFKLKKQSVDELDVLGMFLTAIQDAERSLTLKYATSDLIATWSSETSNIDCPFYVEHALGYIDFTINKAVQSCNYPC